MNIAFSPKGQNLEILTTLRNRGGQKKPFFRPPGEKIIFRPRVKKGAFPALPDFFKSLISQYFDPWAKKQYSTLGQALFLNSIFVFNLGLKPSIEKQISFRKKSARGLKLLDPLYISFARI